MQNFDLLLALLSLAAQIKSMFQIFSLRIERLLGLWRNRNVSQFR
jgi:hypothetical protein